MRVAGGTVLQYRRYGPVFRTAALARIPDMTRYVSLILALVLLTASTSLDAQVGGLLRKKAGEVLGKKPEPAKPAPPAPAAEPAPATPPPAAATAPAPVPAATTSSAAAPAAPAKSGSALDMSALPVQAAANQVLRNR